MLTICMDFEEIAIMDFPTENDQVICPHVGSVCFTEGVAICKL